MADSITNPSQLPLFADPGVIVPKVFHAGKDWVGQPYLYTDEASLALRSKAGQGILVDNVNGVTMSGPISLSESLDNIQVASYWAINPTQLASIGSSAAVPVPWLVNTTPAILNAAKTVANSVNSVKAADPQIPKGA